MTWLSNHIVKHTLTTQITMNENHPQHSWYELIN